MAGLVPAIHVPRSAQTMPAGPKSLPDRVDSRDKPGHDGIHRCWGGDPPRSGGTDGRPRTHPCNWTLSLPGFAWASRMNPLRVLEVSSGVAGAYCGWLLRALGAEVARVGPAPGQDAIGRAQRYWNAGKHADGDLQQLCAGSDILITDDLPRLESLAGQPLGALAASFPHLVIGAASIFGLTGPLAGTPATALDAQAVAGVSWALGEPGREPLSIPPGVLECQAGAHLAAACLMARHAGGGRVADVALADILVNYVAVNCRFYIHHGMHWRRAGRRASDSGGAYPFVILPCQDGDVCLSGPHAGGVGAVGGRHGHPGLDAATPLPKAARHGPAIPGGGGRPGAALAAAAHQGGDRGHRQPPPADHRPAARLRRGAGHAAAARPRLSAAVGGGRARASGAWPAVQGGGRPRAGC